MTHEGVDIEHDSLLVRRQAMKIEREDRDLHTALVLVHRGAVEVGDHRAAVAKAAAFHEAGHALVRRVVGVEQGVS